MQLARDDTLIDQLKLSGPSTHACEKIVSSLRSAHWPSPRDDSWIIVRSIEVQSTPELVSQHCVGKASESIQHAVSAFSHAADQANAVRFSNLPELISLLIHDLLYHREKQRWFWKQWQSYFDMPLASAIVTLLKKQPTQLTSVFDLLAQLNCLADTLRSIDDQGSTQLLGLLSQASGFSDLAMSAENSRAELSPKRSEKSNIQLQQFSVEHWIPVWQAAGETLSKRQLICSLIAVQHYGVALLDDISSTLQMIENKLDGYSALSSDKEEEESATDFETTAQSLQQQRSDSSAAQQNTYHPTNNNSNDAPDKDGESRPIKPLANSVASREKAQSFIQSKAAQDHENAIKQRKEKQTITSADHSVQNSTREVLEEAASLVLPVQGIADAHTACGGTFYLVNALNHPRTRALIEKSCGWPALPSGWLWLLRLAETLQLDDNDPISYFLLQQSGFESVTDIEPWPELPNKHLLLHECQKRYQDYNIWHQNLLQHAANVSVSPSHLDIHFQLSDVDIGIRMAGLDINPGWIPWLGRVVTYHYDG